IYIFMVGVDYSLKRPTKRISGINPFRKRIQLAFVFTIQTGYQRPLLPLLLLPLLLPLLLLPLLLEPDDRDGGDTDDPRELLPDDRGAAVLGLDVGAGRALLLGREGLGRGAGRALLPD